MLISIFRGAGKVAAGTAAGQGIILLVTPFLARQYSPEQFGSLALLLTVSNIAIALACVRYDVSLPTATKHEEPSLFFVAIFAAAVMSFGVMALVGIAGIVPNLVLHSPFDDPFLVGLCILFVGTQQAMLGVMTRDQSYAGVGIIRFSQGGIFALLASVPSIGLLVAHVLSFIVAAPFALRRLVRLRIPLIEVRQVAYDRRDFPLLSLPGAVLDVIGYSACVWIMVYFFGSSETGQYSQIQRIVGAPLMLLGMSVGQVLLRTSVDVIDNRHNLTILFRHICTLAALLGFLLVVAVAVIGEPLLHWFVGDQWRVDTAFIVPITIAVTVRACVSPLSMLLISLRRFDLALRWQVTYFVSSIVVLTMAAFNLKFEQFVIVYALHELLLYGLYLMLIAKAIRNVTCVASSA